MSNNVPIFGPWRGKLDNSDEAIELLSPDKPDVALTNILVPYVVVERVHYRDQAPWPTNADGGGDSLQRQVLAAYGNDPANWFAATPTPGRPGLQTIVIITNVVFTGSQLSLSVESREGMTYYLEYKNDLAETDWTLLPPSLPGTGSILVFRDDLLERHQRFYRVRASR